MEGIEKRQAEPECAQFLNRVGWGRKQDEEAICDRCHSIIYPKHRGAADYYGVVRNPNGFPVPIVIEVKGVDANRFPFKKIDIEQFKWSKDWLDTLQTRDLAFAWIQLGTDAVNSKTPFRRQVYLVGMEVVWKVKCQLEQVGSMSIPMHALATNRHKEKLLTADLLWSEWKLTWIPTFGWWPMENHPFWERISVKYYDYQQTINRSSERTRPN